MTMRMTKLASTFSALVFVASAGIADAAVIPINISGFSGGETVVDYGLTQTLAPVNGMTIGGVLHNFSVGGSASTDAVINGGPGNTNNITVANIEGTTGGILSLLFPGLQSRMGFGWASSFGGGGAIELFDAADSSLGSLSFTGSADPVFVGGFAGIESDVQFARAEVSWTAVGGRFAFDNLRFESVPELPEPSTLVLLGIAAFGIAFARKRS